MALGLRIALAAAIGMCAAWAHAGETLPDGVDPSTGFRMERYRAPVPDSLPGGTVVDTARVMEIVRDGSAALVDVYPPKGAGPDPVDGEWRLSERHETIAGAIWLPEVGRGYLEPDHEAYFRRNLDSIRDAADDRPLLFFCTADCWQSWNAARRAMLWGYGPVLWYPEGTDGWAEAGGVLTAAKPVNFFGDAQ